MASFPETLRPIRRLRRLAPPGYSAVTPRPPAIRRKPPSHPDTARPTARDATAPTTRWTAPSLTGMAPAVPADARTPSSSRYHGSMTPDHANTFRIALSISLDWRRLAPRPAAP